MDVNKRRDLPGAFRADALAGGAWRLLREAPPAEVFLRGVDAPAARILDSGPALDLDIAWSAASATLTAGAAGRRCSLEAGSAIVHEPLPRLYQALPLARADAASRRFWRGVFAVAGLPGGRFLLRALARRTRRSS